MSLRTESITVAMQGKALLQAWLSDEQGQDLIEYMLLASFIAIAGYLGVQAIGINMSSSYKSWDSATQGIWEVPDPVPAP